MTRDGDPRLEDALKEFTEFKKFGQDLPNDPVKLWCALSSYRGVGNTDLLLALLRPIIDQWLDYQQLVMDRTVAGKRGRPLKPWQEFLLERLAVERVKARQRELMQDQNFNSIDALDSAVAEIAGAMKPPVAPSTLSEWVSHRTRLHRRKRKRPQSKNHL